MIIKSIGPHLKKIVDELVEKHGVEWCIARAHKLNEMNKQLLEIHKANSEKAKAMIVARDISVNEKASEYLKQLKTKENESKK